MREDGQLPELSGININDMELVGLSEIAEMLLTRKQQAYRWSKTDDFPEPLVRLRQGPVWDRKDIEDWAIRRGYTGVVQSNKIS